MTDGICSRALLRFRSRIHQFPNGACSTKTLPLWELEKNVYCPLLMIRFRAPTAWTFSNVIAGSDSTAVTLRTVWHNLLTHPSSLRRLREELASVQNLTLPIPTWREVCNLSYLDACIQEAVRLHPAFCLPFERVVPQGGIILNNMALPGGTVVGMNPYVSNMHKPTFGEDALEWNPERFLCGDAELRKKRESGVMTVGRSMVGSSQSR